MGEGLCIYTSKEIKAKLKHEAEKQDRSVSYIVEAALSQYFGPPEKQAAKKNEKK